MVWRRRATRMLNTLAALQGPGLITHRDRAYSDRREEVTIRPGRDSSAGAPERQIEHPDGFTGLVGIDGVEGCAPCSAVASERSINRLKFNASKVDHFTGSYRNKTVVNAAARYCEL